MSGRAMKDSGIEWIGEIPEHWEVTRFRHHFRCRKGLTITKANLVEAGIPVLNYGEIHSKYGFEFTLNKDPLPFVPEDFLTSHPSALLSQGDLIFADTSEDIEGSGNFSQLVNTGRVFAGPYFISPH